LASLNYLVLASIILPSSFKHVFCPWWIDRATKRPWASARLLYKLLPSLN
jgi:hypothetical protein